jgi:hypothetical protein
MTPDPSDGSSCTLSSDTEYGDTKLTRNISQIGQWVHRSYTLKTLLTRYQNTIAQQKLNGLISKKKSTRFYALFGKYGYIQDFLRPALAVSKPLRVFSWLSLKKVLLVAVVHFLPYFDWDTHLLYLTALSLFRSPLEEN